MVDKNYTGIFIYRDGKMVLEDLNVMDIILFSRVTVVEGGMKSFFLEIMFC